MPDEVSVPFLGRNDPSGRVTLGEIVAHSSVLPSSTTTTGIEPALQDFDEFSGPPSLYSDDAGTSAAPAAMDKAWGTAFKINVAVTILSAVCFGGLAIEAVENDFMRVGCGGGAKRRLGEDSSEDIDIGVGWLYVVVSALGMLLLAGALSAGLLHSLISCGKAVLWSTFALFAGVYLFWAVGMMLMGMWASAVLPLLILALLASFFYRRRARVEFGAANLKVMFEGESGRGFHEALEITNLDFKG